VPMNQPCDASVVEQSPVKGNVPAPTQKSEVTQVSLILPFVDSPVVFLAYMVQLHYIRKLFIVA